MNRKHYYEFDRLNVLFCLIVVFIHSFGTIASRMDNASYYYILSSGILKNCAFVVQGFMFLSTAKYMIIYKDRKFRYLDFLWGRVKRVVIPYVISVCIYYVFYIRIGYISRYSADDLIGYIVRGDLVAHFYFVIAILQFYLLMPLWIFLGKHVNGVLLFVLSVIIYVWWFISFGDKISSYDRLFLSYLPYWIGGIAAGACYSSFKKYITRGFAVISIVYVVMFTLNGFLRQVLDMTFYQGELLHVLYVLAAILFWLSVMVQYEGKQNIISRGINNISFDIYLWHCMALPLVDKLISYMKLPYLYQEAAVRVGVMYILVLFAGAISSIFIKIRESRNNK